MECWITAGGAHHTVLCLDITAEMIGSFAGFMDLEFVHITMDTTMEALEDKLPVNDLTVSLRSTAVTFTHLPERSPHWSSRSCSTDKTEIYMVSKQYEKAERLFEKALSIFTLLNEIKPDAYVAKVGWFEDDVQKLKRRRLNE